MVVYFAIANSGATFFNADHAFGVFLIFFELFQPVKYTNKKAAENPIKLRVFCGLAEMEGFEPPVPSRVHLISSQARSTALAHLRVGNKNTNWGLVLAAFPGKKLEVKDFSLKKVPIAGVLF